MVAYDSMLGEDPIYSVWLGSNYHQPEMSCWVPLRCKAHLAPMRVRRHLKDIEYYGDMRGQKMQGKRAFSLPYPHNNHVPISALMGSSP